jgi:outer membrane protein assembly factor BamD
MLDKIRTTVKAGLVVLLGAIVISWAGCSSARRFDPTPEGEFEQAYYYYEKSDFTKAIEFFKQVIYKYPGSELVEQARYYLADSYFQNEDHILAANEFELLNREFPQGQFADVALFKAGLSYAAMSRRPERDQTETRKAMDTFQTLLTKYPNTEYADTVRAHVDQMKDKLARKELKTALFYFDREIYESSIIYLKSVISNYPESTVMPQTLYHLCKASRVMGYPDDAEDALAWLCRDFPDSDEARELCPTKRAEQKNDSLTGAPSSDGGTR